MGMYTELVIKADTKGVLPEIVCETLDWLFNDGKEPQELPNHQFFVQGSRLTSVTCGSSFYHIPWSVSKWSRDYLFSRADLKNYSDEIELFLDWLFPYLNICIDDNDKQCIGYTWYEESLRPSLILVGSDNTITYE